MELMAYEEYVVENPYGGEPIKMFETILHSNSTRMKLSSYNGITCVIKKDGGKIPYFGYVTIVTALGKEVHRFTSKYNITPAKTVIDVNPEDRVELMNIDGLLALIVTRYTEEDSVVERYLIRQGYHGVVVKYPDKNLSQELWECNIVSGHHYHEIYVPVNIRVEDLPLNEPFRLKPYSRTPYELHGVFYQLDKEV